MCPRGHPLQGAGRLLVSRRVSAVPVVDGGRHVLGVVSEADLLRKQERPTGPAVRLLSVRRRRQDQAKAQATVAAELMSRPAITIGPRATLAQAARRLHAVGVKRLPVIDASGQLAGIVSRTDLLKSSFAPTRSCTRRSSRTRASTRLDP